MVRLFFQCVIHMLLFLVAVQYILYKIWLIILCQVTQLNYLVYFLKRTVDRDGRSGCDLSSSHWHEITGNCQHFTVSEDTAIFVSDFLFKDGPFFVTDFKIYAIICIINRLFFYKNATNMYALVVAWIIVWGGRLDVRNIIRVTVNFIRCQRLYLN